jgi:hypothetical protein
MQIFNGPFNSKLNRFLAGNSSDRIFHNRLSYLLLGLAVLAASLSLAGCGGLTASKTASGTPSASAGTITVTPGSVAFGNATVGSPATAKLALANTSSNPVVISALTMTGSAFTVSGAGTLPATMAANSTLSLSVQFAPTAAGSATGQLTVANNSLSTPSITVALSGTGVAATTTPPPTPPAGGTATLSVNSTSVAFGNVAVSTQATQSLTLSSTGSAAVTVSSATASGTGFSVSGATFPLTLNAGQTATLSLQFAPTATGSDTGQLTIASNSSTGRSTVVALSGSAVPLAVDLNWSAPSGGDTISGYNIYRATGSSSSFQKLNSAVNAPDSFSDSTVAANTTYQYYVTSVDSSGTESVPSNTASVAVP